jgi:hypothetical protein
MSLQWVDDGPGAHRIEQRISYGRCHILSERAQTIFPRPHSTGLTPREPSSQDRGDQL